MSRTRRWGWNRKVSASTAALSVDRLTTQLEITTSMLASSNGSSSIVPLRNSTLPAPALADPVRLRLVSLLATAAGGAVCACDLVAPVGKSQPTVSHHLRVLSEAGLVTSERRGRNIWYGVVPAALEALRAALATR